MIDGIVFISKTDSHNFLHDFIMGVLAEFLQLFFSFLKVKGFLKGKSHKLCGVIFIYHKHISSTTIAAPFGTDF